MTDKYLKAKENALKIKRSVSNIIWLDGFDKFNGFIKMVQESPYVSAIELSLFNIFGKDEISKQELLDLKKSINKAELEISGIHNVFSNIDNFQGSIFTSTELFEKSLKQVKSYINYVEILEIEHLSLDYMNILSLDGIGKDEADKIFSDFLNKIDIYLEDKDIQVHIVPTDNSSRDYLLKYVEAVEILRNGKFNKIKLLVDLKEMFSTFSFDLKYFKDNREYLNHFHISNLDGGPMTFTDIPMHNKIVNISYSKDYTNKFFVMKIKNVTDEQKSVLSNYTQFIHVFKEIYQVPLELSPFCSRLFPNLVYRHLSAEGPDIEHTFDYDVH